MRDLDQGEGTGTTVTYWASPTIFETTWCSLETIATTTCARCAVYLNKGLDVVVRDERPDAGAIADAIPAAR